MLSGSDSEDFERITNSPAKQLSPTKCRLHMHRHIEAYCEDCQQLLCIDCILEKHGRHKLSKPDEAAA